MKKTTYLSSLVFLVSLFAIPHQAMSLDLDPEPAGEAECAADHGPFCESQAGFGGGADPATALANAEIDLDTVLADESGVVCAACQIPLSQRCDLVVVYGDDLPMTFPPRPAGSGWLAVATFDGCYDVSCIEDPCP